MISCIGTLTTINAEDAFISQFISVAAYRELPRSYSKVAKDQQALWDIDPEQSVKFIVYLRLITRRTKVGGILTSEVQRGCGLRHEAYLRLTWLAINDPTVFADNLSLFVDVGSPRDLVKLLEYDLSYNSWATRKLPWNTICDYIIRLLKSQESSDLMKKYLPHIRANSKCRTKDAKNSNLVAKFICSLLYKSKETKGVPETREAKISRYTRYRKLKASGTAHDWQKAISRRSYTSIDLDRVPRKALSLMRRSKVSTVLSLKLSRWLEGHPQSKQDAVVLVSPTMAVEQQLREALSQEVMKYVVVNTYISTKSAMNTMTAMTNMPVIFSPNFTTP